MDFINVYFFKKSNKLQSIRNNDWKSALLQIKYIGKENINDIGTTGWNGLHYACFLGFRQIVTELINLHANVNHKTSDDWTPLQLAAFKNHLSVIEVLIGKPELDVNYSSHKKTAL